MVPTEQCDRLGHFYVWWSDAWFKCKRLDLNHRRCTLGIVTKISTVQKTKIVSFQVPSLLGKRNRSPGHCWLRKLTNQIIDSSEHQRKRKWMHQFDLLALNQTISPFLNCRHLWEWDPLWWYNMMARKNELRVTYTGIYYNPKHRFSTI